MTQDAINLYRWLPANKNEPTLRFFVLHDSEGRESKAIYFEDGAKLPSYESFSYSTDGRTRTTDYVSKTGARSDRTEVDFDDAGKESRKRFFRKDGTPYGKERVLWDSFGRIEGNGSSVD